MFVEENGGETVCLTQIQVIDYDSFFGLHRILPHILPHIKIGVTEGVFLSGLVSGHKFNCLDKSFLDGG